MKSLSLLAVASAITMASADPQLESMLRKRQNMIGNMMGGVLNRKTVKIDIPSKTDRL
jgi:hypothetical protein